MDAKGIWTPATSRTNYSSTHTMNNREKQKKLRGASFIKNKENQKGGRPSGRVRGGGVKSNPANLSGNKKAVVEKKKVTAKPTTKSQRQDKAKAMAKANIKKYGGTASAAKANKAAMKLKIKKAYMAKKKKK